MAQSVPKCSTKPYPAKHNNCEEKVTSIKFDVVGHLPVEIIQQILFPLSSEDLCAATMCCLNWKAAVACNYFWKNLCEREKYLEEKECNRSECYTNLLTKYNYWQGVYWYNYFLQRNWETNNYKEVTYEVKIDHCFPSYYFFEDIFAYTNEDDTKLHVYNWMSKEFKPTVFSIPDNVRFYSYNFTKSGNYLIHFYSHRLTVWNLETSSTVVNKLFEEVIDIHVDKNFIVLESYLLKFKLLNIDTNQIEYEYSGMYRNMNVMSGKVVFTTMDDVIHILNCDDKSTVTLKCCNTGNRLKLMVKNEFLLSFCEENDNHEPSLCLWNITTKRKLHSTSLNIFCQINTAFFINEYLYLRNYRATGTYVELWDYMKGTADVKFDFNTELNNVCPHRYTWNDYIIVARRRSKTVVWSFKTKEFRRDFIIPDEYTGVRLNKTKLAYYIRSTPFNGRPNSAFLHVRDFEIDIM